MRAQEVVVSEPKRNGVIRAVVVIVTAGDAVGSLESTVQAFNQLFEATELSRDGIIVGKGFKPRAVLSFVRYTSSPFPYISVPK